MQLVCIGGDETNAGELAGDRVARLAELERKIEPSLDSSGALARDLHARIDEAPEVEHEVTFAPGSCDEQQTFVADAVSRRRHRKLGTELRTDGPRRRLSVPVRIVESQLHGKP